MAEEVRVETVLAPVDRSEESAESLRYAMAIAAAYDAGVHAVYVLPGDIFHALDTGRTETGEVAERGREFVETVRELAAEFGVDAVTSTAHGFSTTRLTRHPGSVVLDVAEETDADFVVVPREPVSGEVLEKAGEYVLQYASQPVLSV